uniref:Uncharacterized protein n=1 Tax=Callorhinchus milii TaxID=7868 RepID=A0A4W3JZM6_CALMI
MIIRRYIKYEDYYYFTPLFRRWLRKRICFKMCLYFRWQRSTEEELMKLAKEFDRNLVEQDVSHEENTIEINQRLVCGESEQITWPQNCVILLSSDPVTGSNTGNAAPTVELHRQNFSHPPLNEEAEAAVNALFDGPTQHISGPLSQCCSGDAMSQRVGEGSHPTKALTKSVHTNRDVSSQVNKCSKGSHVKEPLDQCLSLKNAGLLSEQNSRAQAVASLDFDQSKCLLAGRSTVSENGQGTPCETGTESCPIGLREDSSVESQTGAGMVSCQTATAPTNDEGFDDWDSDDWMDDDCFSMEITQNPELIVSPKDIPKLPDCSTDTANQSEGREAKDISKPGVPSRSMALPSHFQSPTGKLKDTKTVAKVLLYGRGSERPKPRATFMLQSRSSNRVTPGGSDKESKVPVKGEENRSQELPKPYQVAPSLHAFQTFPCTKPRLGNGGQQGSGETFSHCPKPALAPGLKPKQEEAIAQRKLVTQRTIDPPKQSTATTTTTTLPPVDDWNDSEFSDEVLDMLSQSDRLCELEEEEDDEDLYRVCDDVERLMENQNAGLATAEEKPGPKATAHCPLPTAMRISPLSKWPDPSLKPLNGDRAASKPGSQGCSRGQPVAHTNPLRNPPNTLPFATTFHTAAHHSRASSGLQSKTSGHATNWSRSLSMSALNSSSGNHPELIPAPNNPRGPGAFKSSVVTNRAATNSQAASAANGKPSSSKYSFSRITSCSGNGALGSHVTSSRKTFGTAGRSSLQANVPSTAVQHHRGLPLKRLHSDSAIQTKVVKTPPKPVTKCSQAEIERKKLEALARRRLKLQAISPNM